MLVLLLLHHCSNYVTGESVWAQVPVAAGSQTSARKQSFQFDNVKISSSRRCSIQSNSAAATSAGGSSSDSEDEMHRTQAYRFVTHRGKLVVEHSKHFCSKAIKYCLT
jgi:hypothetical protein